MGSHYSLASALVHQLEPDSCAADKAESSNSALSSGHCSAIRILLWSTQRHREGGRNALFFPLIPGRERAWKQKRAKENEAERPQSLDSERAFLQSCRCTGTPPLHLPWTLVANFLQKNCRIIGKRVERTLQPSLHANASAQRWNAELLKKRNALMTAVSQSFQLDKVLTNRVDKTYWEGGRRTK